MCHAREQPLIAHRLSAARAGRPTPAKPKNALFRSYASVTATTREISYASIPVWTLQGRAASRISVGKFILVASNLVVLLVCSFYKLNPKDKWQWEEIGYRTGWIAMAQLPLIFLLAGKNNIIGFLTGSSHERLNWLHRWTARSLLLVVTLHMGYWFASWDRYKYIGEKLKTDAVPRSGLGAWAVLAWIVLSSMTFFTSTTTPLYSTLWTPTTRSAYAGTCLFLILLACIGRGLFALKHVLERRWLDRARNRRYVVVAGEQREKERVAEDPDAAGALLLSAGGVEEGVRVVRRHVREPMPWRLSVDAPRAVVVTAIAGVGYLL